MKILQYVTQMEAGGAQKIAIILANGLREKGHDVETVFLYKKRTAFDNEPFLTILSPKKPRSLIDYLKIIYSIFIVLRDKKPHAVISHTYYSNIISQLIAFILRIQKRIAVQHRPVFAYKKTVKAVDLILGALKFYTHNIAVSATVFDSFDKYPSIYRKRMQIINNGVSFRESSLSKNEARKIFNLTFECPLLVNVGRLSEVKNQAVLIDILRQLPEVHLAIAGGGELHNFLCAKVKESKLEDRVHILGEISPNEIPHFLRAGDIFLAPSKYEAFGLAPVEAVMSGLPVIASDIPAYREVLKDSAILLSLSKLDEWIQAVQRILNESSLSRPLLLQSRTLSYQFSVSSMVCKYEKIINDK